MTRTPLRAIMLGCALSVLACQPSADAPGSAGSSGGSAGGTGGPATGTGGSASRNGASGGSGGSTAGSGGSAGTSTGSGGTSAGGVGRSDTGGNAGTGGAAGSAGAGTGGSTNADAGGQGAAETGGDTSSAPPPSGDRASAACGKGVAAPAEGLHTLKVGAMNRRFFLRLPASYDGKTPLPVIFGFHGAGNKDAAWFDTHTGLRRENEERAVLVFGEALFRPGSTSERSWQEEDQLPDNLA
jgi:hypothetical protein